MPDKLPPTEPTRSTSMHTHPKDSGTPEAPYIEIVDVSNMVGPSGGSGPQPDDLAGYQRTGPLDDGTPPTTYVPTVDVSGMVGPAGGGGTPQDDQAFYPKGPPTLPSVRAIPGVDSAKPPEPGPVPEPPVDDSFEPQ